MAEIRRASVVAHSTPFPTAVLLSAMGNVIKEMSEVEPCVSRTCYLVGIGCGFGAVILLLVIGWFVCSLTRYSTTMGCQQPLSDINRLLCGWRDPHSENESEVGNSRPRRDERRRHDDYA